MSKLAVIEAVRHTYITGAGGVQIVADVPGGGADGKTLCALVSWRGIGVITPAQAGWTEHYDFPDSAGPQLGFYTRPATDSDPDTYTFDFSGSASRVVAALWYISNSDNGIEVFSAEASGTSEINAVAPDATSPGEDRLAVRIWNRANVNNLEVPGDIFLRWNSGGPAGGAVGHVATKETVGAGAVGTKTAVFDTTGQNWRAVTLIVGPGSQYLSVRDRLMAELSGYEGSISDREYQRLLHLLQVQIPSGAGTGYSLVDLYKLAEATGQGDGIPRIF